MALNKVRFILKNGTEIPVLCNDLTLTTSNLNGKLTAYSFSGVTGSYPMYLDFEEIAAIVNDREVEKDE